MGKKLFKSITDLGMKPKGDESRTPARVKHDELIVDESAAFPDPLEFDDREAEELSQEISQTLTATQERAAKYAKPTVEFEEIAAADDTSYLKMMAEQTGMRYLDLSSYGRPPDELIQMLEAEQAKSLGVIPVYEREDGVVVFAVSDPSNPMITDDLHAIIDQEIEAVIAVEGEIAERIEQYYGMGEESLDSLVAQVEEIDSAGIVRSGSQVEEFDLTDLDSERLNDAPVIKFVNLLLLKAISERASDIHIEPFPNLIRIRYRVDGILKEIPSPKRSMLSGIVSRIKVMAMMNITENRLPLDGRVKLVIEGREVDLRVSTVPTVHGEAVVMRVLDKSMMMIGISQIGMTDELLERYNRHIMKPNGIVLVTGPTGCGKTTTLYAALNEINDPGEKLITVEDPVEYELKGITQININETVGLTFSKCLRAILRHDPDRVLVGEIRDVETAQIAVQAALTGHLVFSTLHTNSAAATMTRLIDMGVKPFLITSSVEAIVSQRLVRTICSNCRVPYTPNETELSDFALTPEEITDQQFFYGEGCADCGHSGYRGRMGLFELLEINDEMRELILDQGSTDELQEMSQRNGMTTMRQDGWLKISLGLTSFEEVARETPKDSAFEPYRPESEDIAEEQAETSGESKEAKPPIEKKATPKLDDQRMAVEGEAGARIYEVGDAQKTAS